VVVDMPPVEILDMLKLSADINSAIIDGAGPLGALLRISQAAERGDAMEIDSSVGVSDESGALTPAVLAGLQVEAAEWFGAHRLE
jgi:hypothetical protein